MSLPTFSQARDEIQALFQSAWNANSPALNGGTAPRVEWDGVSDGTSRDPAKPYAAVFVRHSGSSQATLGRVGQRRFNRRGLVVVQVYTPINNRVGLSLAESFAIIARNAYEGVGTSSGIWFRNTRINEIGPDKSWYRMDVLSEFEYDELK